MDEVNVVKHIVKDEQSIEELEAYLAELEEETQRGIAQLEQEQFVLSLIPILILCLPAFAQGIISIIEDLELSGGLIDILRQIIQAMSLSG